VKIYLAGRFGRQTELRVVRLELSTMGFPVTSRWLDQQNPGDWPDGTPFEVLNNDPASVAPFAVRDMEDLLEADTVISFTDGAFGARGGRHVEFGLALALGKRMLIVGPRENLFHTLGRVEHHPEWAGLAAQMENWCADSRDQLVVPPSYHRDRTDH
jgi:hypothetical protein